MRNLSLFIASSLLALVAACGGSSKSAAKPTTAERPGMSDDMCPMSVTGTSVAEEDTATGGALVFTTTGDVAELRKRVNAIATMHNEHHMGGDHDMAGKPDMDHDDADPGMQAMMHAQATASDTDGGARLELAVEGDDVSAVQATLREHAQGMQQNGCAMMHEHMKDMHDGDMHDDMHHD